MDPELELTDARGSKTSALPTRFGGGRSESG
jgi:hypothetical protein